MPYDKPKPQENGLWKRSGVSKNTGKPWEFYSGNLVIDKDFILNGVNLNGCKIPVKVNPNIFWKNDSHPAFRIELNDWQPSGKATKPEHALALAASIRKQIEPAPMKLNDEKQMPSFFDDEDCPF